MSRNTSSNVSSSRSMIESLESRQLFAASVVDTSDTGTLGLAYTTLDASKGNQTGIYHQLDSIWAATTDPTGAVTSKFMR